jgi:hypothetical protein
VANAPNGVSQENCPAGALQRSQTFGSLTLAPVSAPCVDVPARGPRDALILWRLQPGETLTYRSEQKKELSERADAAGMWQVPENVAGKVCQGRAGKH